MIQNEQLRLQNTDLLSHKEKYTKTHRENEIKISNLEVELKITKEENKKLKLRLQQTETEGKFENEELRREVEGLRES